jgi:hypothetical protein
MTFLPKHRLGGMALALSVGLALTGVSLAQELGQSSSAGLIMGEVDRCINGAELPASQVAVGIQDGSANMTRTDDNGQFVVVLPPGEYTIVANASDGTSANRQYVPVEAGESLDIGILDLGGGLGGCGSADEVTAPVMPTFTPTATDVPVPPTPTPAPTSPPATATPMAPAPDATPGDSGNTGSG